MIDEEEKLHADARLNRDRILKVAREALAADPRVSLNSIGKTAGVGQGTLYRHFPSREALVVAVYRKEIEDFVALAPALLAQHPPLKAFRLWCDRLAEFGRMKYGVADMLHAAISAQDVHDTYGPMVETVHQLIEACESAGDIGPGTNAEDVLTLLGVLWQIPPGPDGKARADRLITFVFRGLGVDDARAQ